MDPVLSSLLQTNQIGSDGFNWWIGQVETGRESDPKKSGRYRVRIVGTHLKEGQKTPTEELPWANVVMPVTTPFSDGGVTGATAELRAGNWVIGFFLDNDKQKPVIMGSIGHTAGSTVVKNDDPKGGEDGPREFTTHTDATTKPQAHRSQDRQDGKDPDTGATTDGGEPDAARSHEEKGAPAIIAALRAKHSETNPIGSANCVTIANPKCGNESNFDKQITNIIADLLAANQQAGGQIGSFYVSKINGFLYDKVAIARHHIGRVTRLVRSLMGRIQSEIIRKLREGIELAVTTLLGTRNATVQTATATPKDPKSDHRSEGKKGNLLKSIKKILDQILKALGCAMENLIERLVQFLTDLLFSFIMEVFSPAACAITNLVEGIINKILELVGELIDNILGPLQDILGILAAPLDMIGGAINKVMSFLGISCSGPSGNCTKQTVKCNDCGTDEDDGDFLDNLLNDIEEGDTGERFYCEESQDYPDPKDTKVVFVGGIPTDPIDIPEDPDDPPGSERPGDETPPPFFPEPPSPPPEDPEDPPETGQPVTPDTPPGDPGDPPDDPPGGGDDPPEDGTYPDPVPTDDEFDDDDDDDDEPLPLDFDGTRRYGVRVSPTIVGDGDRLVYTITTSNVPADTVLNYKLTGDIVEEYINADNPSLEGTVKMLLVETIQEEFLNDDEELETVDIPQCRATVDILLNDDVQLDTDQYFRFSLFDENDEDTGAFADATILGSYLDVILPDLPTIPASSISVTTEKTQYEEGEDIEFLITSENITEGSVFEWFIYGDVDENDFVTGQLKGRFTIKNNAAKVTVGILDDLEIEELEELTFRIKDTEAERTVYIIGGEDPVSDDDDDDDDDKLCLDKPIAGDPITDDDGGIVEIPINNSGCPYEEPPFVIITGEGFGATGIALLDDKGYVSEIRVTKSGLGYKRNLADDNGLRCIIDSFTMISPGIKYTSAPKVYIDGAEGGAKAIIDDRGYVISVQIIDRKKTYKKMPSVRLVGGGGSGAIFLPNMVCLEPEDLNTRGLVKIGTGKYIDCP